MIRGKAKLTNTFSPNTYYAPCITLSIKNVRPLPPTWHRGDSYSNLVTKESRIGWEESIKDNRSAEKIAHREMLKTMAITTKTKFGSFGQEKTEQ